jgi:DNA-binding transcriptional LysR family regulator
MDWIGWSPGHICHDWLVHTLRAHGAEPRIVHTASEYSTQLALVAAGLGAAVITRLGREPAPEPVRFVEIEPAPVRRVFALAQRSAAPRRPGPPSARPSTPWLRPPGRATASRNGGSVPGPEPE